MDCFKSQYPILCLQELNEKSKKLITYGLQADIINLGIIKSPA
jgi:hypothetical protein